MVGRWAKKNAYADIKTLSPGGYAIWTASQAQRPKSDIEIDDSVLSFRNAEDCYVKAQKVDFIGSINQTKAGAKSKKAKLIVLIIFCVILLCGLFIRGCITGMS